MLEDERALLRRILIGELRHGLRQRREDRPGLLREPLRGPGADGSAAAALGCGPRPGGPRFRSVFVFPIELAVWGGGAVMVRAIVRQRGLGWWSLLLFGLALAIAEEFLIQQTSVAPLVIRLKGETWARAFGVNYIYLLWALVYESAWVVLMPTLAVELVFPERRREPWLSRAGAIVTAAFFAIGCFFAWFSWTQIARTKVFHQPPYAPPLAWVVVAVAAILLLIFIALRLSPKAPRRALTPPRPWLLSLIGAIWAVLWF